MVDSDVGVGVVVGGGGGGEEGKDFTVTGLEGLGELLSLLDFDPCFDDAILN